MDWWYFRFEERVTIFWEMKSSLVWNHQVMMRGLHRYGASSRRLYSKPNMNINCNTQENPFAFASDWTRGEFSWVIWKSLKDKNLLNSPLDAIIGRPSGGFWEAGALFAMYRASGYLLCTAEPATMYRSTTYSHYVQSQPAATFNHLVMQAGRTLQSPSSTHTIQYWQHTACQYCQYWHQYCQYWQHTANTKCQLATLMHWIISHTGWHTSTLTLGAFNCHCKGRRFALQHVSSFASNCAVLIQDLGI